MRRIPTNQLTWCTAGSYGRQHVLVGLGRAITKRRGDRVGDRLDEAWMVEIKRMDSDAENRLVVPALQKAGCEPDRPPSTCTGARGPRDDRCVGHRVTLQVVNAPVILGPHKTSLGERRHQCLVGEPRGRDECGRIRAEAGPEGFATPVDPIAHLGGAETQELAFAGREKSTFEPGPQRSSIGSPRLWLLVMVPVKAPVHV